MLKQLQSLTTEYAKTADGRWLNEFDWKAVPVKFKNFTNGVIGCHFFGKITLMKVVDAGLIFDIYIHELRHVWQWKKRPVRYLLGKLIRPLIERDADREEKKAFEWYNKKIC